MESRKGRCKVKGEQVITVLMAQQLETKKFNVLPGQLFCRFDDQDKFQTVTDTTDNGFTECQRK